MKTICAILDAITAERARQDKKFGEQNHPDLPKLVPMKHYPLSDYDRYCVGLAIPTADYARRLCNAMFEIANPNFASILVEEVAEAVEAAAEQDPEHLKKELIEVAAVCVAWIEAIERRETKEPTT